MPDRLDAAQAAARLQPYVPTPENPWNRQRAGHLLRRAGFGATPAELHAALQAGPQATIETLLSGRGQPDPEAAAALAAQVTLRSTQDIDAARGAWLLAMIHSPHPLLEKLTLFWHGHFATAHAKVADTGLMIDQIDAFRAGALGHFGPLLHAMTADPAMILWLDNNTNRRGHPNENYAREIMELFSLGVGHYTETDIREAGRAFTGWHTANRQFRFQAEQFDDGPKTVLGRTGPWGGRQVVDLCLAHPACPRFIVAKLFAYLAYDNPDPALLDDLAQGFRDDRLHVGRLVGRILASREFFSPRAYRAIVKSPVSLVVGAIRGLSSRVGAVPAARAAADMGQALYDPPSVKGWDGGRLWLNSATVLARTHFAQAVARGREGFGTGLPAEHLITQHRLATVADAVRFLTDLLVDGQLPTTVLTQLTNYGGGPTAPVSAQTFAHLAQLTMSLPEYQLD